MPKAGKPSISLVLIVGTRESDELELAHQSLRAAGTFSVHQADDLNAALLWFGDHSPELIIVCESHPGGISAPDWGQLRAIAPLAVIWRLVGPWCEGEQRSGSPPPGVTTTYWHEWPARAARELAAISKSRLALCELPATTTADEKILWLDKQVRTSDAGTVLICAAHAETASTLADTCQAMGYRAIVAAPGGRWNALEISAIVWDARSEEVTDIGLVSKLRQAAGRAPIIALTNFPRPEDQELALLAGVAATISKPFLVADLAWRLSQVAPGQRAHVA